MTKDRCPECLGEFAVRADGMIRYHGPHPRPCPGGGKPPAVMHDPLAEDGWARVLIVDPDEFRCICDPDDVFDPPDPTPRAVEGCPAHRARRVYQQWAERHPGHEEVTDVQQ